MSVLPEARFRVGRIRVTVWPDPLARARDDPIGGMTITIDSLGPGGHGTTEYSSVLEAEDSGKAILALKKAHDYLQLRRRHAKPPVEFVEAATLLPVRIP